MGTGASVSASPDPIVGTWYTRDGKLHEVTRYNGLPDEPPVYLLRDRTKTSEISHATTSDLRRLSRP